MQKFVFAVVAMLAMVSVADASHRRVRGCHSCQGNSCSQVSCTQNNCSQGCTQTSTHTTCGSCVNAVWSTVRGGSCANGTCTK